MSIISKTRELFNRFTANEDGSLGTVWGAGLLLMMSAIGTGIDLASVSRVTTTAQSAADQVALTSAVFYSSYARTPENRQEGFMNETVYKGGESGFNFPNTVLGGNQGVDIIAYYNEKEGQVVVEVEGETKTALMGMFGVETLPFKAVATAQFKQTQIKNPASIILVLDNSGSMSWDDTPADCSGSSCSSPPGAESRIEGLRDSVRNFMDILDEVSGEQAVDGARVLRTGMIPYDDQIINNREVGMHWGLITTGQINAMEPSGSTNSAPPIARAWDWMQVEPDYHEAETGEDNPLRYMIFMTDGQNSDAPIWQAQSGTNYWRGIYCRRRGCYYLYRDSTSRPNISGTYDWEEGIQIRQSDSQSKNTCEAMKAQGVRVFTIGFALEPGTYMSNYPASWGSSYRQFTIDEETTTSAYSLLADCASSGQDFVAAADTNTLDEAFTKIGETIVEDVIRLTQ